MVYYICHPYGGKQENYDEVSEIVRLLVDSPHTILSPIHMYGWMYDIEYEKGLQLCFGLLELADEMIAFGDVDSSVGCTRELQFCRDHGIPYRIMTGPRAGERFMPE